MSTFEPGVTPPERSSERVHLFVCGPEGLLVREAGERAEVPLLAGPSPQGRFAAELGMAVEGAHYLGRLGEHDCYAASPAPGAALPAGAGWASLRKLYGRIDEGLFWVAGRAVQVATWDTTHRFCGRCAQPTTLVPGERARRCPACGLSCYPRISPAVIMLVRKGEQALLARNGQNTMGFYSTLAGFVEPGETLEEAVAREVREEVGVRVQNVRYFGNQPWPFPHSLMIGFTAEYAGGELRPDGQEIVDAQWFRADALPPVPPRLSIARQLIDAWVGEVTRPAPG